ncbi:MAG: hypothetical protein A2Y81_06950 [Nitrospirae bacterium RBG_13_43_8]|nr:MAG: hypothetical protein A2Y81_06950 [Nitrospirae bacterium RBG_13_43_8]
MKLIQDARYRMKKTQSYKDIEIFESLSIKLCVVIVRLARTIQNLLKILDSPIKSWNDRLDKLQFIDRHYLIAKELVVRLLDGYEELGAKLFNFREAVIKNHRVS